MFHIFCTWVVTVLTFINRLLHNMFRSLFSCFSTTIHSILVLSCFWLKFACFEKCTFRVGNLVFVMNCYICAKQKFYVVVLGLVLHCCTFCCCATGRLNGHFSTFFARFGRNFDAVCFVWLRQSLERWWARFGMLWNCVRHRSSEPSLMAYRRVVHWECEVWCVFLWFVNLKVLSHDWLISAWFATVLVISPPNHLFWLCEGWFPKVWILMWFELVWQCIDIEPKWARFDLVCNWLRHRSASPPILTIWRLVSNNVDFDVVCYGSSM